MGRGLAATLLVLVTWMALSPFAAAQGTTAQEAFKPLIFDETTDPYTFPADFRLDSGSVGSIEIGVTLPAMDDALYPQAMTLVAHEDEFATRFRVVVGAKGTRIGFADGEKIYSLQYDFTDGGFFQIGLSIKANGTDVFINGEHIGVLPAGYGKGSQLPLHVGAGWTELDGMIGEVNYLRLWHIALKQADYKRTAAIYGNPSNLTDIASYLTAYSVFTDTRQAIIYTQELGFDDLTLSGFAGAPNGRQQALVVPDGGRVFMAEVVSTDRVISIMLRVETPAGHVFDLTIGGTGPVIPKDKPCVAGQPCTATRVAYKIDQILFAEGDSLVGIAGTSGAFVNNIVFLTDGGPSQSMGSSVNGPATFELRLADGMGFDGLAAFTSEGINAIAVGAAVPLPFADVSGRWVGAAAPQVHKLSDAEVEAKGGRAPHGNYSTPMVFTMQATHRGKLLNVAADNGWAAQYRLQADGSYRAGQLSLKFTDSRTMLLDGALYARVDPYQRISPGDPSFQAFGGTFDLDLQVPFTQHMFLGTDVAFIDPQNLQDTTPLRKPVFRQPSAIGRDYYPSYQKIVPFGLTLLPDTRERSQSETVGITSAADYSATNSNSIGVSIGIPKVASFGYSQSTEEMRDASSSTQTQLAVSRDTKTEMALVVDTAHIEIDPRFARRIQELTYQRMTGQPVNWNEFIQEYGTHYAYAMTIGTVSHKTLRYSKAAYRELKSRNQTTEFNASLTIKNAEAGVKSGSGNGFSQEFQKEMDTQIEQFDAVGSDSRPVPVFLDLRPLSDLLSASNFDDAFVWQTMRAEFAQAITSYALASAGPQNRPEDIWEPYLFTFAIDRIEALGHGGEVDGQYLLFSSTPPQRLATGSFVGGVLDDGKPFKLGPAASQTVVLTATEICFGGPNGGRWNITSGTASGMRFQFDPYFVNEEGPLGGFGPMLHNGGVVTLDGELAQMKPIDQKPTPTDYRKVYEDRDGSDFAVAVVSTGQRLADLDGNFKEMPTCP